MGLYPALDETSEKMDTVDGFRLHQISDIKHWIDKEREFRLGLYKKYPRAVNTLGGVKTALVTAGMGLCVAGVGLLSTIIAVPIVLGMEVAAGVSGLAGIAIKFISLKLQKKALKHDAIRILAEAKLNSIEDHNSTAMADCKISKEEFRWVLSELTKYKAMKQEIRSNSRKTSGISKDEKKSSERQQAHQLFCAKTKNWLEIKNRLFTIVGSHLNECLHKSIIMSNQLNTVIKCFFQMSKRVYSLVS